MEPAFLIFRQQQTAATVMRIAQRARSARRGADRRGVASGEFRAVHASFVADTAAATMGRIQSGAILTATGLGDADAYDELATLLLDGIRERIRLPARIGRLSGVGQPIAAATDKVVR